MRACSVHNCRAQCAQCRRTVCITCACSVHNACMRALCSMRACSVHNSCVQCAQSLRLCSCCWLLAAGYCLLLAACCSLLLAGCRCCWPQYIVIHCFATIFPTILSLEIALLHILTSIFEFSRMRLNNAPSFVVKGFLSHVWHYTCQQFLIGKGQWQTPSSKRGAPRRPLPQTNLVPQNFRDADLMFWVNEGLNETMLLWMNALVVKYIMVATSPEELYVTRITHFPCHKAYKDPSFQEMRHETNDESD